MEIKIIEKGCEIHYDDGTKQTLISQKGWVEYDHAFAAIQSIEKSLKEQLEECEQKWLDTNVRLDLASERIEGLKEQLEKERESNIKRIKGYVSILDKTTTGNVAHNRSVLKCSMKAAISNIEYRITQNQSKDGTTKKST